MTKNFSKRTCNIIKNSYRSIYNKIVLFNFSLLVTFILNFFLIVTSKHYTQYGAFSIQARLLLFYFMLVYIFFYSIFKFSSISEYIKTLIYTTLILTNIFALNLLGVKFTYLIVVFAVSLLLCLSVFLFAKKDEVKISGTLVLFLAFFSPLLFLFVKYVFLNPSNIFVTPTTGVSFLNPIGADFIALRHYTKELFYGGNSPYIGSNLYPPLVSILFFPVLLLTVSQGYFFMLLFSIACFFGSFLILEYILREKLTLLSFVTPLFWLFSYGMLFELERGQFNVISIFLLVLALYFRKKGDKLFSLILFSLSVQLKVFPIIFLFIYEFFEFKLSSVSRYISISLLNLGLLFILGAAVFKDFLEFIYKQISEPYIWIGNHSLKSFCSHTDLKIQCNKNMEIFLLFLLLIIFVAFLIVLLNNHSSFSYFFAIAGILTLVIPSVSHDYKLSLLPIYLFPLTIETLSKSFQFKFRDMMKVLFIGISYCLIAYLFYPQHYKPEIFLNNFPLLFLLYISLSVLFVLEFGNTNIFGVISDEKS